jgi:hypothetical protein
LLSQKELASQTTPAAATTNFYLTEIQSAETGEVPQLSGQRPKDTIMSYDSSTAQI